jgi:hypothetical protein
MVKRVKLHVRSAFLILFLALPSPACAALFRESHGPAAFVVAHEIPAFQEQLLILTSSCREGQ